MKIWISDWNNILHDVIKSLYEKSHDFTDKVEDADVVVMWNEAGGIGRPVIEKAKELGIRTVLLQHGRRGSSRFYPPFSEKLLSDVICVWGPGDVKRLRGADVPADRIITTGTTIHGHMKPREKHQGINVVFSPEHWPGGEIDENKWIADELKKLPKKYKVTTKILSQEHDAMLYDNPVGSNRNDPYHLDTVADVLKTADVVVGMSESTFELLAESMDIPVVIADIWVPKKAMDDERYLDYQREYSNACTLSSLEDLNKNIKRAIKKPKLLRKERAQIAIDDGGTHIENPKQNIINIIENVSN